MFTSRLTGLLLASTLVLPTGALAQERAAPDLAPEPAPQGTQEGAEALQGALEAYIGTAPFELGILSVEPDAAGQRITLDPAEALSGLTGRPVRFAPLSYVVSERDDGTWNVFSDDPLDAAATFDLAEQESTEEYRQDWQVFRGVFSPEFGTFLSAVNEVGPTTQTSSDSLSRTVAGIVSTLFEQTATPAEGGGVDVKFRQTGESYAQSVAMEFPLDATQPDETIAFSMDGTIAAIDNSGSIGGARSREMLDLSALILTHAEALSEDATAAMAGPAGEELFGGLTAALPLWNELDMTMEVAELAYAGDMFAFDAERMVQTLRMSGIDENAFFETQVALSGIGATSPMLPEWAGQLIPRALEFGLSVSDVDLAAPLDIALREADFSTEDVLSEDARTQILEAFDAERIRGQLTGGRIEAETFDLTFEGDVSVEEAGPDARINVEMGGLDETIAVLQAAAADMPQVNEVVGMLQMAKGFSQPGANGRAVWQIEARADGSVDLNGTMLVPPDEAGAEDAAPSDEL